MSSSKSPRKPPVKLAADAPRPSRIRREPPPLEKPQSLRAYPTTERETWIVVIGVLLFGIAITIITLGISDFTNS
ncbi:MAG TPA: hypothetical protein VM757_07215 [Sphingomicrobium sp.]|jgi:hypothetical protein|nr:hypothetical protein [Sphingomicrobium sp.]